MREGQYQVLRYRRRVLQWKKPAVLKTTHEVVLEASPTLKIGCTAVFRDTDGGSGFTVMIKPFGMSKELSLIGRCGTISPISPIVVNIESDARRDSQP
jgi:hypothetical protein